MKSSTSNEIDHHYGLISSLYLMKTVQTEKQLFFFYQDPACQNISTEFHCYLLDPVCSTQTTMEETTTRTENDVISNSLGVASSIVFILVLGICIICLVKRKFWATKGKFITSD